MRPKCNNRNLTFPFTLVCAAGDDLHFVNLNVGQLLVGTDKVQTLWRILISTKYQYRVNIPLRNYNSMLYLPVAAITLMWDPCKNHSERLWAWSYDVNRLTEVVGHQRRRRDRRLGELLSPTSLLLQVLQENGPMMEGVNMTEKKPCVWFTTLVLSIFWLWMIKCTKCKVYLTSVLTSRTDLKSLDIEASLDCGQVKMQQS